jgi:KDO2-lipid IV(A) lauroyltransferase
MRDAEGKVKRRKQRRAGRGVLWKDRLEYALLRMLAFLVRSIPIEAGSWLFGKLLRLVGPLTARHRRALDNLMLAFPDMSKDEHHRIARRQWENLGRTFGESFSIDRIANDPDRLVLEIADSLEATVRAPGGWILVGMHSANWEVAAFPARRYRSLIGLYQPLTNPLADSFVKRLRAHVFDGGLLPKGRDTSARVMQWVRDGNAVAMLNDHLESRGIAVTMFGHQTLANPFPAMVARRLEVPLLAAHAIRLPGCRFRMQAVEIPVQRTADPRSDVQAASQAIQDYFEAAIRKQPGDWMWVQDRWGISRARRRAAQRQSRAALPPEG